MSNTNSQATISEIETSFIGTKEIRFEIIPKDNISFFLNIDLTCY